MKIAVQIANIGRRNIRNANTQISLRIKQRITLLCQKMSADYMKGETAMDSNRGLWRGKCDNGEWVEGDLIRYSQAESYITVDLIENEVYTVDTSTLGECTGSCDKNGKLSFEGDLIKDIFGEGIGVIRYGEYKQPFNDDKFTKHIGFYIDWLEEKDKMSLRADLGYWLSLVEIIGNIHDDNDDNQIVNSIKSEKETI